MTAEELAVALASGGIAWCPITHGFCDESRVPTYGGATVSPGYRNTLALDSISVRATAKGKSLAEVVAIARLAAGAPMADPPIKPDDSQLRDLLA